MHLAQIRVSWSVVGRRDVPGIVSVSLAQQSEGLPTYPQGRGLAGPPRLRILSEAPGTCNPSPFFWSSGWLTLGQLVCISSWMRLREQPWPVWVTPG